MRFEPGVVERPDDASAAPPDAFSFAQPVLRSVLAASGADEMRELIRGFRRGDEVVFTSEGDTLRLTDWSDTYVLRLPNPEAREALLQQLRRAEGVIYAERNAAAEYADVKSYRPSVASTIPVAALLPAVYTPDDTRFGEQWALNNTGQTGGTPDADIDAVEAWDIEQGASWVKVAIIDSGVEESHSDLANRATGDLGHSFFYHGTFSAGVAGAQGDNALGVAGVAWNVEIIDEDIEEGATVPPSIASTTAAVQSATIRGAHTQNLSLSFSSYPLILRQAMADAYRAGILSTNAMGNRGGGSPSAQIVYPAAFEQGALSVGATSHTDARTGYSSYGEWIDVAAPGGTQGCKDDGISGCPDEILSLDLNSSYRRSLGTSFAAPHVAGLGALLLSHRSDLQRYPDDVAGIIRASAEDVNAAGLPGFDIYLGHGRINARAALDLLSTPNTLARHDALNGGTVTNVETGYTLGIYNPNDDLVDRSSYNVDRYTVERTVPLASYVTAPHVWGRGVTRQLSTDPLPPGLAPQLGWGEEMEHASGTRRSFGLPTTEVVASGLTSATLRTYVYYVRDKLGNDIGWYPVAPADVDFAYTVVGEPCTTTCGASVLAAEAEPLRAWPNPANRTVYFTFEASADARLSVYDVLGREVAGTEGARRLDVSAWAPGVYVAQLEDDARVETVRFTVVR